MNETKEKDIGISGCTTIAKPFSFSQGMNDMNIFYKGNLFTCVGMSKTERNLKSLKNVVESLNQAYQLGFQDCGNKLMPEIMGQKVN